MVPEEGGGRHPDDTMANSGHNSSHADGQTADMESNITGLDPWLSPLLGVTIILTFGSLVLATVVSPSFEWQTHALSNLGVSTSEPGTRATAILFNGGLVLGGAVGVVFGVLTFRRQTRLADRAVIATAVVALFAMALVGVFPQGTDPHFPVAIAFFLLITGTLCLDGLVRLRDGDTLCGLLAVVAGGGHLLVWALWWTLRSDPYVGIAIPELVGAVLFGAWLVLSGRTFLPTGRPLQTV